MPQTGISGVCPHSIYLSPFHWDFLTPFDCLKTKGWQWKKVLWAFMAFGCHGRGVSSDTAASLQPQWPPPMGKAQLLQHWESHGKGRNALQCHISDRRTLESRGLWGESCFCCVPKIVESGHWRWKTSSYSVVPLHSTGAETTQTTSPYTLLFCHFELSGTTTGEDWLMLPQESFYRQDLRISDVCITSSGNQLFRVIIDYTNIHNNLWFLFPLGAPIFALKEWTHMIPMSCDPASAIYTDSRIKLINAFYNALLWLRLFVPLSNQFGAKISLNRFFTSCISLLIKSDQNQVEHKMRMHHWFRQWHSKNLFLLFFASLMITEH